MWPSAENLTAPDVNRVQLFFWFGLVRSGWLKNSTSIPTLSLPTMRLNSVSASRVTLISSKSRVYLLRDRDQVGLPAGRSVRFPKWTDLIGRAGFDTKNSIPDPTLSLKFGE